MGSFLLQHPLVQCYLVGVGLAWLVVLWDWWCNPAAPWGGSNTPRPKLVRDEPRVRPPSGDQKSPRAVSGRTRRTDEEEEPVLKPVGSARRSSSAACNLSVTGSGILFNKSKTNADAARSASRQMKR